MLRASWDMERATKQRGEGVIAKDEALSLAACKELNSVNNHAELESRPFSSQTSREMAVPLAP